MEPPSPDQMEAFARSSARLDPRLNAWRSAQLNPQPEPPHTVTGSVFVPVSAGSSQPVGPASRLALQQFLVPVSEGSSQPVGPASRLALQQFLVPVSAGSSQPVGPASRLALQQFLVPVSAGSSQPVGPPSRLALQQFLVPVSAGSSQPGGPASRPALQQFSEPVSAGSSQPVGPASRPALQQFSEPVSAGSSQPARPASRLALQQFSEPVRPLPVSTHVLQGLSSQQQVLRFPGTTHQNACPPFNTSIPRTAEITVSTHPTQMYKGSQTSSQINRPGPNTPGADTSPSFSSSAPTRRDPRLSARAPPVQPPNMDFRADLRNYYPRPENVTPLDVPSGGIRLSSLQGTQSRGATSHEPPQPPVQIGEQARPPARRQGRGSYYRQPPPPYPVHYPQNQSADHACTNQHPSPPYIRDVVASHHQYYPPRQFDEMPYYGYHHPPYPYYGAGYYGAEYGGIPDHDYARRPPFQESYAFVPLGAIMPYLAHNYYPMPPPYPEQAVDYQHHSQAVDPTNNNNNSNTNYCEENYRLKEFIHKLLAEQQRQALTQQQAQPQLQAPSPRVPVQQPAPRSIQEVVPPPSQPEEPIVPIPEMIPGEANDSRSSSPGQLVIDI